MDVSTTYPLWIGGQRERGSEPLVIRSPYDGRTVGETTWAGPDLVERAIAAAAQAFRPMAELSSLERSRALALVRREMENSADDLAHLMALEAGKPIKQAAAEVERALLTLQTASEEALRIRGETLPLDVTEATRGHVGIVQRFPAGPVLGISPFNFPLNLAMHKVAAAIAAGDSIVLKPTPKTPLTWLFMAGLFAKTDLPAGAVNVVVCSDELATRMVQDERFKVLSFTGSVGVGWRLKALAGKKKVILELGGNAGAVIDETAELAAAARKLAVSAFAYAGQSCISAQRLFPLRSVEPQFTEGLVEETKRLKVGDPLDPQTDVGPMIEPGAVRRTQEWLQEAVDMGATVLIGGAAEGNFFHPTILKDTPPQARVCSQEVFAPLVNVLPCYTFEEAVERVNDSQFGLQAALFTRDLAQTFAAYRRLEVGGVIVNEAPSYRVDPMPYGGVKDSGFGREGLRYSIEELTEPRLLVIGGASA
jgi:glyceraldehyde-3-phosphate dehydrogenase (NADP+)